MKTAYGIDGCRNGWVVASYDAEQVCLIGSISELLAFGAGAAFLIDIPIGLPSRLQPVRNCEEAARHVLPRERKSSVFGVPCREALSVRTFERANTSNRRVLGKGLSLQSWYIGPKILEVDDFLAAHTAWRSRLRECHPEIAFQFLNGGDPLRHGKKTAEGRRERFALLQKYDSRSEKLFTVPRHPVAKAVADDVLDALCLALTLKLRQRDGLAKTSARFVSKPLKDASGLEMAIYYYQPNTP